METGSPDQLFVPLMVSIMMNKKWFLYAGHIPLSPLYIGSPWGEGQQYEVIERYDGNTMRLIPTRNSLCYVGSDFFA